MRNIKVSLGFILALVLVPVVQAAGLPDFTRLVEKASPGVVNISTVQNQEGGDNSPFGQLRGPNGEPIPDIFRHFFRDLPQFREFQRKAPQSQIGRAHV